MTHRKFSEARGLEYRSLKRKAAEYDRAERNERARLIQWAQAGDPAAITLLHTRYHCRLPLVESGGKDARR